MNLFEVLKKVDKNIGGSIFLNEKEIVLVTGKLYTSKEDKIKEKIEEYVSENYPDKFLAISVDFNKFEVSEENEFDTTEKTEVQIDEIEPLYMGFIETELIKDEYNFKLINVKNEERMNNAIRVMNFITPLILDENLRVIDGKLRLRLAKQNDIKKVPVMIIRTSDIQKNTLELVLNRSQEFQRWDYPKVDDFIDANPQIQPIVEPLGFFGRYVLPESFFANTVIQYKIDPFNTKQQQYHQEKGLANWAKIRRKQLEDNLKARKEQKEEKKPVPRVSIFDLQPTEEDFLETYDIEKEKQEFIDNYREVAGRVTDTLDKEIKKRLEETGQPWQGTRRTSEEKSRALEEKFRGQVEKSKKIPEEEKEKILNNLGDYAKYTITELEKQFKEDSDD